MKPLIFKNKDDLLTEIFLLAVKYNREDFNVFVTYSGHVEHIDVSCYCGGWRSGGQRIKVLDTYKKKITLGTLNKAINYIESLSRDNEEISHFIHKFENVKTIQ